MESRKIYKYSFTKSQLSEIPRERLKLFLVCASILNELNFSTRFVFFASNRKLHAESENEARNAQALYLIRLLVAKIWESWEAIRKCMHSNPACRELSSALDGRYSDALNTLNTKFGKKTVYKSIREELAFHLDGNSLIEGFLDFDDATILSAVIGPTNMNSLFMFSEDASSRRLLKIVNPDGMPQQTLDDLATEVLQTGHQLGLVAEGIAIAILQQHCPRLFDQRNAIEVDIHDCPEIHEVSLPFFVQLRDEEPER